MIVLPVAETTVMLAPLHVATANADPARQFAGVAPPKNGVVTLRIPAPVPFDVITTVALK